MLKNKQAKYKPAKKHKIPAMLLGVMIGLGSFGTIGGIDYAVTYYNGEDYMPYSEVVQFCDDLDLNMSYFSFETSPQRQNTRAVFPKEGIKLNIYIDNLTEDEKNDLQRAVDDLNAVFQVIRPENKFVLEFNPSLGDKLNKYYIDVYEMPEEIEEGIGGDWNPNYQAHNKNGLVSYHSKIELKRSVLNYNCFLHEIFHHLGFGDAYIKIDELDTFSIMLGADVQSKHMHRNDIAILAARYGDNSTPEKKQALIDYINSYESQQDWYKEYKQKADELVDKLATSLKIDKSEINLDLAGKTYIKKPVSFDAEKSYNMISFDKQKMEQESIGIKMKYDSNEITTSYFQSGFSQFLDDIDGIDYAETVLGTSIYCEVDGTLYLVSQTPPIAIGELASLQDVKDYEAAKLKWQQEDSSTLTRELVETLFTNLDKHIPMTDKKITSADNLKLYNETLGEITIGKQVTIKGYNYAFEYYKGGIFIPTLQYDAIFIFPDYNNNYIYIQASRMGNYVKYTFSKLEPMDKTASVQSHDIDNEFSAS